MTLASPCIGVCRLDPAQTYCTGCGRSWGDIGEWTVASEARQREILAAAELRAAAALAGETPADMLHAKRAARSYTPCDVSRLADPATRGRSLRG